jgi:hypothetical protein
MKAELLGARKIIMSNPTSYHNYFGWPTVARLKNGRIAVGASGYRLRHVCPFGKTVLSISEDNGETYPIAAPVIDTVLDDRDAGLCPFGESGLIVTSFNNATAFQRSKSYVGDYALAYLDMVTAEDEAKCLGSTFRVSFDNGVTFGPLYKSPITSPHGPVELADGTILWVGRTFNSLDRFVDDDRIKCYTLDPVTGEMEFRGAVEQIYVEEGCLGSCEPHTIQLPDGKLLCHIRVQEQGYFSIFQSESTDGGYTWSKPQAILDKKGGAPSHMILLSDGVLLATYGYRSVPCGIRYMVSRDLGKTWSTGHVLYEDLGDYTLDGHTEDVGNHKDIGYPSTVELDDGSLLTIYYAHPTPEEPSVIFQQKWKLIRE